MKTICLNMIVKNESYIIEKTLENIYQNFPLNYWVISDTGSTDNTVEIIKDFFNKKGILGEIHHEPWQNFSFNRNQALKQCLGKSDYILFFDADDYVTGNLKLPILDKDAYYLSMSNESQTVKYLRKLIVKNNGKFYWRGVLHEFLENTEEISVGEIIGEYQIISGRVGHRSLDPNKYLNDAQILEKTLYDLSPSDLDLKPRYQFYCAQSYKDAGIKDKSFEWYLKRAYLEDGWSEERYCSFMQLGFFYEEKKQYAEAISMWQQGITINPQRAECWYHIARRYSWNGNLELAYCFSKYASGLVIPQGNYLFVQKDIYQYWCLYEWCLNAYRLNKIEESYQAFKKLVQHCPVDLLDRLSEQNKSYTNLVEKDQFFEVQQLIQNLHRLDRKTICDRLIRISL